MNKSLEQLASINPSERILLLPHCLRSSDHCRAKYNQHGLVCASCDPDCPINQLRGMALKCGYKGICVAPGGRLAVKFVKETRPRAIVAVACEKELEEGVQEVNKLTKQDTVPTIIIIPLTKNGCIDTKVDHKKAIEIISLGCQIKVS